MKGIVYIFALFFAFTSVLAKNIHDPLFIFCGSENCYDILGVERIASDREIKKAYRKLSLTSHPDKNREENATEVFRLISKAYEVLTGNETRKEFDYYLDHPRDYFKVSGQHYFRALPKSDVRVVILVSLLLVSWLMHSIQSQRYERVVRYLKEASSRNLGEGEGGTKQTKFLFTKACERYAQKKEGQVVGPEGERLSVKDRERTMMADPLFLSCVDQVVREVKVEGGSRKPALSDLLIVRMALLPVHTVQWSMKYYRRHLSSNPLSLEERREMASEALGLATWHALSEEEQEGWVEREVWTREGREAFDRERERLLEEEREGEGEGGEGEGEEVQDPVPESTKGVGVGRSRSTQGVRGRNKSTLDPSSDKKKEGDPETSNQGEGEMKDEEEVGLSKRQQKLRNRAMKMMKNMKS